MKRLYSVFLVIVVLFALWTPIASSADAMATSQACIDFIKYREGFSAKPYWDNSQWTVGYGTKCPADKLEEYQQNGITEEAALELLASMMTDFERSIQTYAEKYHLNLTQQQFDALVSFSFNCGAGWTSNTNGYLNTAVREGWTGSKFIYAMCLWGRSGGDFILIKRRLSESNIYMNGIYGTNSDIPDNYRCVYLDGNGGEVRYIPHGFDANDPIPIIYSFTTKPTGVDENGNVLTYDFNGWYTETGRKVEVLDESIEDGSILYAQWADAQGNVVTLPKGTPIDAVNVTVDDAVNIRSGPGTHYPSLGKLTVGTQLTITETYEYGGRLWGKSTQGWLSLASTNYDEAIKVPEVWPKSGIVNATHVNVRSGPGLTFERQYQLNVGDAVTIHEKQAADNLDWGRLDDNNWICLTYVTLQEVSPQPPAEEPEPTPEDPPKEPEPPPSETLPEEPVEPVPPAIQGDMNNDETVDKDDSIYLLRHILFPDKYPLDADGDIDVDGDTDKDDAIYLLRHVLFPEKYPLNTDKELV